MDVKLVDDVALYNQRASELDKVLDGILKRANYVVKNEIIPKLAHHLPEEYRLGSNKKGYVRIDHNLVAYLPLLKKEDSKPVSSLKAIIVQRDLEKIIKKLTESSGIEIHFDGENPKPADGSSFIDVY